MLESHGRQPRDLAESARRAIMPDLLRRRNLSHLEPLILDPESERDLTHAWMGTSGDVDLDPKRALTLRERIERYAAETPRDRAAIVCTTTLRPILADFLIRSGVRIDVLSYNELPRELSLTPSEVISIE
jgi:flagellar biosynthesis component FlhA